MQVPDRHGQSAERIPAVVTPPCLVLRKFIKRAQCGACCALAVVAMFALMRYRRSKYSMQR
jgi:hypothetical protein